MRQIIFFLCLNVTLSLGAQMRISGNYQGLIVPYQQSWTEAQPLFFSLTVINNLIDGSVRYEFVNTNDYYVLKINGTLDGTRLQLTETRLVKESRKGTFTTTRTHQVNYNENNGYFEGFSVNPKTKDSSRIVVYKSAVEWNDKNTPLITQSWVPRFINDLENNLSSPEKRLEELRKFSFQPIFFDYDKSILKTEYETYLLSVIKMVKSHSDIRIKIIGHTDADGSNHYNLLLSKKRAESIIQFLEKNGLPRDRVVIDFKGEKQPIDSNKTEEGKRKNRRVDFDFI